MDLTKGRVRICIEIKVPDIEEKVVQAVEGDGLVDKAVVLSFIYPSIERVKELNPGVSTGALVAPGRDIKFVQKALSASADLLLPPWNFATPKLVEEAHKQGLSVIVWTVDELQAMSRMMGIGVDGIATNYPERLKSLLTSG